ncbi:MAG: hypothetical protein KJ740_16295, partial [Gammaproteobacteria bacterium]|nr:hypothetical protein [Gammaproteobacteria bacterium]
YIDGDALSACFARIRILARRTQSYVQLVQPNEGEDDAPWKEMIDVAKNAILGYGSDLEIANHQSKT